MDYDSSTKFISSLAKFLQSLCNGYVEFDNGVEVIGHIYLSVDTGKKIDYILNEKVCKTDENSVTFISNSFHAQPAEKPKPTSKKGRNDQTDIKTHDNVVEIDNDSSNQVEPRSTNSGTIPRNSNRSVDSPSQRHGKRPFSPHSRPGSSPGSKKSKNESQEHGFGIVSDDGNLSTSSPTSDPLRGLSHSSSGLPSDSNYSQSYDQGFNPADNSSIAEDSEERDIKPSMDTDVTFVKEEFTPSSCSQVEDDGNQSVDASFSSMYHSNQSYSGGGGPSNQAYSQQNSRLSYSGAGERSDMYDPGMGSSHMEGNDTGADPSGTVYLSSPGCNGPSSVFTGAYGVSNASLNAWNHQRTPYAHTASASSSQLSSLSGSFGSREDGRNPMRSYQSLHGNLLITTCPKCGGIYTNPTTCANHAAKCNGSNRLMCRFCKRVYSQMCALKEHMRGKHGVGEMLACKQCGRSFKYKPQLYDHNCPNNMNQRDRRMGKSPLQMSPPPFSPSFHAPSSSASQASLELETKPEF